MNGSAFIIAGALYAIPWAVFRGSLRLLDVVRAWRANQSMREFTASVAAEDARRHLLDHVPHHQGRQT